VVGTKLGTVEIGPALILVTGRGVVLRLQAMRTGATSGTQVAGRKRPVRARSGEGISFTFQTFALAMVGGPGAELSGGEPTPVA